MIGLDDVGRTALENLIAKARQRLETDLALVSEGKFGIYGNGQIEEERALKLTDSEIAERRDLVNVVEHLQRGGESPADAVKRLLRETAFTHLNRLIAVRVAEAIGLVPESLARGKASQGFRDVLEIAPLLASDATGGYWEYLQLCAGELAGDAPNLFDPRNPLLALRPSAAAVEELVDLIVAVPSNIWLAADTFGWTYGFFNTQQERREMRVAGAPSNSRELAVRNQFFTPRYVVDFLVQNSLGRRLIEAYPDLGLSDDLPLLVDQPSGRDAPLRLDEVRVLDPACGSGHFLLGCYDVLESAWKRCGTPPAEAAGYILPCLFGIDIDPRCAQVASAALVLRARRACPRGNLPKPNIFTARSLPDDAKAWERVLGDLAPDRRRLVTAIREALRQAPVLGSLLKVEERLRTETRNVVAEATGGSKGLFADLSREAFSQAEADVLKAIQRVADEADSSAAERLLAAEAGDAIGFVDAMRQRYDAVLMNPPFGEPVEATKPELKAAYPWIPTKDYNLLAAFVGRGLQLCREEGYVGAITSRVGMFHTTFEKWRKEILLGNGLVALADLGHGVMEQALVEAAAFVLGVRHRKEKETGTFIRLLRDSDRSGALARAAADVRLGVENPRVYRVRVADFAGIPGSPVAYWMASSIRRLFLDHPGLEGVAGAARQGLATGDDFRFVRAFWEVLPEEVARSRQETTTGRRWVPFAKGGEYSPYWSDIHLVVDYQDDGQRIRSTGRDARLQNPQYYFRAGLTWPLRTASAFGVRVLPSGTVFGHKGPAVIATGSNSPVLILAWLTSRLAIACMAGLVAAGEEVSSGAAAKSYEVGLVQKLPWPGDAFGGAAHQILASMERLVATRRSSDYWDETSRSFLRPWSLGSEATLVDSAKAAVTRRLERATAMIEESLAVERLLHEAVSVDAAGEQYLDEQVGKHPARYSFEPLAPEDRVKFERLFVSPIDQVIDEVIAEKGGSRVLANMAFIADRRLEVLAHTFERHPQTLVGVCRDRGLLPPEEPRRGAEDLISYLVGVAFGRWDARIGKAASLPASFASMTDPFQQVTVCAPGMLLGPSGLPATNAPAGYPIALPPEWLFLDESAHEWDLERAVTAAAGALLPDIDAIVTELQKILDCALGDYLRKQFFKFHVGRYTKSRRKAPIYWQLCTPSRTWGVWLYAPRLSREMLFAINRHAANRVETAERTIGILRADREAGGRGRSMRDIDDLLESEERLLAEVRRFRTEADRIAGLGWDPDLNDGASLCAAPLANLFPAWPEAAAKRAEIQRGQYSWAKVSRWAAEL